MVGGFAYECNNFSGTMDAVRLVVPDPAGQAAINVLLGPLCCALLLGGSSERIGMMLSVVVAFMIACFAATLGGTGLPPRGADGLVPNRTLVAYLTDADAPGSGETFFPALNVSVAPARGAVLAFDNTDAAGAPDPAMRHGVTAVAAAAIVAR